MRTIKFRGKDKRSDEWIHGNLYNKDIYGRTLIHTTTRGHFDVEPETVGQFTGLYDDNGNEIYEGDIVKVSCLNYEGLAEIRFKEGCFCMVSDDWFETLYGFDIDALEVVGNTYDSPKIIKKMGVFKRLFNSIKASLIQKRIIKQSTMKIRFKKLDKQAVMPVRAHETDAGYDLTATNVSVDPDSGCIVYGTGIAIEIPIGYVGLVYPRSSIADRALHLTNSVGVIDSGYRGEIMAKFRPSLDYYKPDAVGVQKNTDAKIYSKGDRIAQLIIMPVPNVEFVEADDLSDSDRGNGGYGSTGK